MSFEILGARLSALVTFCYALINIMKRKFYRLDHTTTGKIKEKYCTKKTKNRFKSFRNKSMRNM
jgi:hypothetical protein